MPSLGTFERGCGYREKNGIYAECPTSLDGRPIEEFLLDPPVRLGNNRLGITPVGVSLRQPHPGANYCHIFDWIGSEHYPNVADWVEETREFGLSRRLPKNLSTEIYKDDEFVKIENGYSMLTEESRIVVVHARAWIDNPEEIYLEDGNGATLCRQHLEEHAWLWAPNEQGKAIHRLAIKGRSKDSSRADCCVECWWHDVEGGEARESDENQGRSVVRDMPALSYKALSRPEDFEPEYEPAFFGSFPLANIAVIVAEGEAHLDALERARAAGVNVNEEDE